MALWGHRLVPGMARESPAMQSMKRGLSSLLMYAQSCRASVRGSASLCVVRFLVRPVWSDQCALPNRAFALRLRLRDFPVGPCVLHSLLKQSHSRREEAGVGTTTQLSDERHVRTLCF
jgi:hypothetical protein